MHLYLYAGQDIAERNLFSPALLDLTYLWHRGFLDNNSTVWVNSDHGASRLWALTDHSHFVLVIDQPTPGYVRVTQSEVRWARTFDASVKNPIITEDLTKLPGGSKTQVTVIAKHMRKDRPITVIDGGTGKSVPPSKDGATRVGNVTVVDWPNFVPKSFSEPSPYETVNAELNGIEFLCGGLKHEDAEALRKHMKNYRVEIEESDFTSINTMLDNIDYYSRQLITYIQAQVSEDSEAASSKHSKELHPASS